MIKAELFIIKRDARPALIEVSKKIQSVEDVPEQTDVIVITGRLNRVPTDLINKTNKAVKERFLRRFDIRWNDKEQRWANGSTKPGKIVINV